MNEPTALELALEEKRLQRDLENLEEKLPKQPENDDLDDLLNESVKLADKRKKISNIKEKHQSDLFPFCPEEGLIWEDLYSAPLFIKSTCSCGHITFLFSHYMTFQRYIGKNQSKPSRWVKLDRKPELLARPRYIKRNTPVCDECQSLDYIVPFNKENRCPQMTIFSLL